jgi:hypothetical protein
MSSIALLSTAEQMLTRYGMSTYVAFGNLGNLLAIAIFVQRDQRRNPCSLYLLWMTICNLICLDVGIIPIIFSLDHQDISNQYLAACRIQFYIRHTSFQIMRTYKVLACIDRFALSSVEVRIRSFSQRRMAIRLIIIFGIFWALAVIFFSVVRTIQNGSCNIYNDLYSLIYTIYYIIFAGVLPPFLIVLFSLLVMRNLKQMRSRVQPTTTENPSVNILRKRDRDLMRMVLIEVMFYVISTMPFSIYLVYKMITNDYVKSKEQNQIESFINYMTQSFIMYFNTALPFYIYISTSSSFRRQCKKVIIQFYAFMLRKEIRRDDMDRTMSTMK